MNNSFVSRRRIVAGATLLLPFGGLANAAELVGPLTPQERQHLVFKRRRDAANAELNTSPPTQNTNGDEDRYPDRRASFSKTLPHDEFGEVDTGAYRQWLAILTSGDPAKFDLVPRDPVVVERLNDPQAAYATDLVVCSTKANQPRPVGSCARL